MQLLLYNYYYVCVFQVLEGGMGRKRRLQLVESGQCSSHAIGSQQEETHDAALEEDIPHGTTYDHDAIEPPGMNSTFQILASMCVLVVM